MLVFPDYLPERCCCEGEYSSHNSIVEHEILPSHMQVGSFSYQVSTSLHAEVAKFALETSFLRTHTFPLLYTFHLHPNSCIPPSNNHRTAIAYQLSTK